MQESPGEKLFYRFNYVLLAVLMLVVLFSDRVCAVGLRQFAGRRCLRPGAALPAVLSRS